jgi:hypothetical protein
LQRVTGLEEGEKMRIEVRPDPGLEPKVTVTIDAISGILPVHVLERKAHRTTASIFVEGDKEAITEFIAHLFVTIPVRDGVRRGDCIIFDGDTDDGVIVARHPEGFWGISIRRGSSGSGETEIGYYFNLFAAIRALLAKRHSGEGYPTLSEARRTVS